MSRVVWFSDPVKARTLINNLEWLDGNFTIGHKEVILEKPETFETLLNYAKNRSIDRDEKLDAKDERTGRERVARVEI